MGISIKLLLLLLILLWFKIDFKLMAYTPKIKNKYNLKKFCLDLAIIFIITSLLY